MKTMETKEFNNFKIIGKFNEDGSGNGVIYFDRARYEGDFDTKQRFHGKGIYRDADGNIYEGDFIFGKLTGTGKIIYFAGGIYTGEVLNFKKEGEGVFETSSCKYEGDFIDDHFHGDGILYDKFRETKITCKFIAGCKITPITIEFKNGITMKVEAYSEARDYQIFRELTLDDGRIFEDGRYYYTDNNDIPNAKGGFSGTEILKDGKRIRGFVNRCLNFDGSAKEILPGGTERKIYYKNGVLVDGWIDWCASFISNWKLIY